MMQQAVELTAFRQWLFKPNGPFVVQAFREERYGLALVYLERFTSLADAVEVFVERWLPAERGTVCQLGDIPSGSSLAGYSATEEAFAAVGDVMFFALKCGIEALEASHKVNIIDLAIWESQAKRVALGVDW